MKQKIEVRFEFDGTTQGNIDRDAFWTAWNAECQGDEVCPTVSHGVNTEYSEADVNGNIVTAKIFYTDTNPGITAWNAFWNGTIATYWTKETLVKTDNKSTGNKHKCGHDGTPGGCSDFTYLTVS